MAYDLHIERKDRPIALSEWQAVVEATGGVRLYLADQHTATNPSTSEIIAAQAREGDTEVFFPATAEWRFVFRWARGSATFAARFDPSENSHPAWRAATALASRLGATIRGERRNLRSPDRPGEHAITNQLVFDDVLDPSVPRL